MSLAYTASPWISDTNSNNGQTQKRVPTMRKTLKKIQTPKPEFMAKPVQEIDMDPSIGAEVDSQDTIKIRSSQIAAMSPSAYMSQEEAYKSGIIGVDQQDARQERVYELLNKMGSVQIENDGGNLAEFKPLEHPFIQPPAPPQPQMFRGLKQTQPQPSYSNASISLGGNGIGGVDKTTTYQTAYEIPAQVATWSRGNGGSMGASGATTSQDQRILDKINYMIHLLEQQQNEKTNHALEEFVMFSLVGVFIIYVLDSFSRSAKYTR